MQFKSPKNTEKYFWTQHAAFKLRQYGLSAQRVIRVINNPQRKEEGIVLKTIAVMQPASVKNKNGKKVWSQEIWAMYRLRGSEAISKSQFLPPQRDPAKAVAISKIPHPSRLDSQDTLSRIGRGGLGKQIKIISAWRYPGVSPQNNPIPEEILREISELSG